MYKNEYLVHTKIEITKLYAFVHLSDQNGVNRQRIPNLRLKILRSSIIYIKGYKFNAGFIPGLRPRFAAKCDPQSKDLTQLPSGYNFAVKSATNHPS